MNIVVKKRRLAGLGLDLKGFCQEIQLGGKAEFFHRTNK